jgi:2-polyprenyl-6-methoxyphenol hydroxylase-like FAD-dependent oxidoreductase
MDGLGINWGKKLEDLTTKDECVRLTFADGEIFDADFVVGADGASSKVRELLMDAEAAKPSLSGFMIASGCVKYGEAKKVEAIRNLHPVAGLAFCPDSAVGCGSKFYSQLYLHIYLPGF